jgi:DNA polymerase III subunit gamma/tau
MSRVPPPASRDPLPAPAAAAAGPAPAPAAAPAPPPAGSADARWRAVVEAVEQESSMAASALKQAAVLGLKDGEVALQLPPGMFAATLEKRRAEVEAVFGRFFGRPTRLSLAVGAAAAPAAAGEPPPPATPSLAAAEAAERTARAARVREAARAHPNIQEAVRLLEGSIDKIEEI